MKRTFLGKVSGAATRQRVFRVENGLEVDDIDHFEVTRRRVFFDDVVSLTRHRHLGIPYVVTLALVSLLFLVIAFITRDELGAWLTFLIFAACFLIPLLLRVVYRIDVITVSGRRTRAVMHFSFRKKRAAAIFAELDRDIRAAQQRLAAQIARQEAASERPAEPFETPPA